MPYCSNCGAKLTDTAAFCSECGTKVIRPGHQDKPAGGSDTKRPGAPSAPQPEGFSFDAGAARRDGASSDNLDGFGASPRQPDGFSFDAGATQPGSAGASGGFESFDTPEEEFDFSSAGGRPYRSYLDEGDDFSFTSPSGSPARPAQPSFDGEDGLGSLESPYVDYDDPVRPGASRGSSRPAKQSPSHASGGRKKKGSSKRPPQKKRRTGLIVLLCLLLLAAVGVGVFVWAQNRATPEELYQQGIELMADGEYEKASEKFLKVLKKEPDNVDAILNLSDCYVNMTEKEKAVELLQAAYAKTQDERIKAALEKLGMTAVAPETTTTPPETTTTTEQTTAPPPASPSSIDLNDVLFGKFDSYQDQFGTLRDQESTTDSYQDANGNEVEGVTTTYTYDGLTVITLNGVIMNMTAHFDQDIPFHVLGIGKGATYNQTLNTLGAPETAAAEEGYDTLVYLPENGKAVKYYFLNDTLVSAALFLGYSQNG